MYEVMGRIRLAPGRAAFYDEVTRIHLTISNPESNVIVGMNTINLKNAVRYGTVKLVYGTLDASSIKKPIASPTPIEVKTAPVETKETVQEEKQEKTIDPKVEDKKEDEVKKEVVEEKAAAKKKSTKKVEDKKEEAKEDK